MNVRKQILRFALCLFLLAFLNVSLPAAPSKAAPKYELSQEGGDIYCYTQNGRMLKNKAVVIDGKTYFFGPDGRMLRRVIFSIGDKTYCATKDGSLAKDRVITYKKKKYYFDKNGLRVVGLVARKGNYYYFCKGKNGGYLQDRWKKIGGSYYYFNEKGRMCRNMWVGDYYVDASGRRIAAVSKEPEKANDSKTIRMANLLQNPELPTGCESVALTMVLNYYGFNLSKTTIASAYLPLSSSGNFVTAFAGSPFSSDGAGIYAPGLTATASSFLKAKRSSLRAYDLTGMPFEQLYRFLDNNTPVIVWNSMYMRTPQPYNYTIQALGKSWRFYRSEHCVALAGYDKEKNRVLINDSLSGLVWRDADAFERIYNTLGKMAVVIQ